MKNQLKIFLAIILIVIGVVIYQFSLKPSNSTQSVTIDNHTFNVELAKNPDEQQKGLGDRNNLDINKGMLFIFDKSDYYSFWMKDMRFPLDMIFIRGNKIVYIFQNVPIKPFNNVEQTTQPADKVLEINAGLSKKYGFKIGDIVIYNL